MISSDEGLQVLCGWKEKRSVLYAQWFLGKDEVQPLGVVSVLNAKPDELTLQQGDKKYSFALSGAKFRGTTRENDPQLDKILSTDPLDIFLADKSRLTLMGIPP
jgi:rRNA maturation protein Rpf1